MNIFVVDLDPEIAATNLCDKHIPKMTTETAQMLAGGLRAHGAPDSIMPRTSKGTPYKGGYANHPCTIWAGQSRANFDWLARHGVKLAEEFKLRFGKTHACELPIKMMAQLRVNIPMGKLTPFAQAMPDEYKDDNPVKAYRSYYLAEKRRFAEWNKGREAPEWFLTNTNSLIGKSVEGRLQQGDNDE